VRGRILEIFLKFWFAPGSLESSNECTPCLEIIVLQGILSHQRSSPESFPVPLEKSPNTEEAENNIPYAERFPKAEGVPPRNILGKKIAIFLARRSFSKIFSFNGNAICTLGTRQKHFSGWGKCPSRRPRISGLHPVHNLTSFEKKYAKPPS